MDPYYLYTLHILSLYLTFELEQKKKKIFKKNYETEQQKFWLCAKDSDPWNYKKFQKYIFDIKLF